MKLNEIKEKLNVITDKNDPFLREIESDERKGVQKLINSWYKNYEKYEIKKQKFLERTKYEAELYSKGYSYIAGIDEVGRGPLAGPVVTAAVILPQDFSLYDVNDSKKLSSKTREKLFEQIKEQAVDYHIGICTNGEIDEWNIYEATKIAMTRAINGLKQVDYLLIDAMSLDVPIPQKKIIKGDSLSISIAAASILAKVTRDKMMEDYAKKYPGYDFENNAGYGTKKHLEGIEKNGITPIHRKTFAPIKNLL